jgi:hypothetical protein
VLLVSTRPADGCSTRQRFVMVATVLVVEAGTSAPLPSGASRSTRYGVIFRSEEVVFASSTARREKRNIAELLGFLERKTAAHGSA